MPRHARQHSDGRCAKTAEPVEMPFGLWIWVGPRKHVLDGVQNPLCERAIFMGQDMPGHARRHSAVSYAKTAEAIEMPFELPTWVGRRKHALHGGTLAPPGEYDWTVRVWTVRVRRRRGLMSNYFDLLLRFA